MLDSETDVLAEIDRLHEEAEDLADQARHAPAGIATGLRSRARRLVREAARFRAQIEEGAL